jgi:uncharacterized protein (TIGR03435 family)
VERIVPLIKKLAFGLLLTAVAVAHSQGFTSIEVKPAHSSDLASRRIRVLANGDLSATSVNVISLISDGYDVPGNPSKRLSMLPPWVYSDRFDIEAKASPGTKPIRPSDPDAEERVRGIFREVLVQKFHLVIHATNQTMPVYALTLAGGSSKLNQSQPTECVFDTEQSGCHSFVVAFGHPLNGNAVSMDDLTHYIENWTDLPVVNKSSLAGLFILNSEGWQPMNLPPPPPGSAGNVDFSHLQTIDTVLGSLGLTLHKEDATVPVYEVQQIHRP